jgi:hypothetical protein
MRYMKTIYMSLQRALCQKNALTNEEANDMTNCLRKLPKYQKGSYSVFLGSFRYRKSANFLGVPLRKMKISTV